MSSGLSESPYGLDQLNADVAADPAHADKYFTLYQNYQKIYGGQSQQQPKTQFQQERTDLINALMNTQNAVDQGSINYGPIGSRVEVVAIAQK